MSWKGTAFSIFDDISSSKCLLVYHVLIVVRRCLGLQVSLVVENWRL